MHRLLTENFTEPTKLNLCIVKAENTKRKVNEISTSLHLTDERGKTLNLDSSWDWYCGFRLFVIIYYDSQVMLSFELT